MACDVVVRRSFERATDRARRDIANGLLIFHFGAPMTRLTLVFAALRGPPRTATHARMRLRGSRRTAAVFTT